MCTIEGGQKKSPTDRTTLKKCGHKSTLKNLAHGIYLEEVPSLYGP